MYRIKDKQFNCRYLAGGSTFNTKKEACEQLIDFHSNDCDMSAEQKLLDKNKIDECWRELEYFEWELEEVEEDTARLIDAFETQIDVEKERAKNPTNKDLGWTSEYHEGFIAGLKRGKEILSDN